MASTRPDIDLLDVNVWLALTDENHVHHGRARRYWDEESGEQIAFKRVTMLGFVRLLTNRVAMNSLPLTASEAWQAYRAFRALLEVTWIGELYDDAHAADTLLEGWLSGADEFSTLLWTYVHLASIVATFGCRLVSFDGGYRNFQPLDFLHLTV